jgi:putative ubiquitin-RnfH superfamily antitoxin RatB of RatAB toxin-antitoxin module
MASADEIDVEVVYATPKRQFSKTLVLPVGSSVEQAIRASGLLEEFPELDLARERVGRSRHPASRDTSTSLYVGVFGEFVQLDDRLQGGERVEIYRPLQADPKETRRRRAKAKTGR